MLLIWAFSSRIIKQKKGKVAMPKLQLCNDFPSLKVMKQYQAVSQTFSQTSLVKQILSVYSRRNMDQNSKEFCWLFIWADSKGSQ